MPYGSMCVVVGKSALLTRVNFLSLRMRLGALVPSRWRLPECMRKILPVAVILKRFFAPRWVLSFNLGFVELRGIALNPLRALLRAEIDQPLFLKFCGGKTARIKTGPKFSSTFFLAPAPLPGAGPAPLFGGPNANGTVPSICALVSLWL